MKNRVLPVMAAGVAVAGLIRAAPEQALDGNHSHASARGRLIRTGLDKYTSWFTRTDTSSYIRWCIWGTGSSVTVARV